jgi:catechol 2,3-dioxygenase-like lactoylglutathione lyase family enzyme
MSGPLTSVGAITLFVEDPQRSKAFYEEVFGAPAIYEDESSVALGFDNLIVNLLARPAAHELIEPGKVGEAADGVRFQLTIWVDDADAVCAQLATPGVERHAVSASCRHIGTRRARRYSVPHEKDSALLIEDDRRRQRADAPTTPSPTPLANRVVKILGGRATARSRRGILEASPLGLGSARPDRPSPISHVGRRRRSAASETWTRPRGAGCSPHRLAESRADRPALPSMER